MDGMTETTDGSSGTSGRRSVRTRLRAWLLPRPTPRFLLRAAVLAAGAAILFDTVLLPVRLEGRSMEPAYSAPGFTFVWTGSRDPARGDVVALRWEGRRKMLLKRVLAFEGETVAFSNGVCFVDGTPLDEPYVAFDAGWNLPPRTVSPGCLYVMGDNRGMDPELHVGGEISRRRVVGKPLW